MEKLGTSGSRLTASILDERGDVTDVQGLVCVQKLVPGQPERHSESLSQNKMKFPFPPPPEEEEEEDVLLLNVQRERKKERERPYVSTCSKPGPIVKGG
ncbi:hypothetical protein STEG23_012393, partial [Scotinomys teguina]